MLSVKLQDVLLPRIEHLEVVASRVNVHFHVRSATHGTRSEHVRVSLMHNASKSPTDHARFAWDRVLKGKYPSSAHDLQRLIDMVKVGDYGYHTEFEAFTPWNMRGPPDVYWDMIAPSRGLDGSVIEVLSNDHVDWGIDARLITGYLSRESLPTTLPTSMLNGRFSGFMLGSGTLTSTQVQSVNAVSVQGIIEAERLPLASIHDHHIATAISAQKVVASQVGGTVVLEAHQMAGRVCLDALPRPMPVRVHFDKGLSASTATGLLSVDAFADHSILAEQIKSVRASDIQGLLSGLQVLKRSVTSAALCGDIDAARVSGVIAHVDSAHSKVARCDALHCSLAHVGARIHAPEHLCCTIMLSNTLDSGVLVVNGTMSTGKALVDATCSRMLSEYAEIGSGTFAHTLNNELAVCTRDANYSLVRSHHVHLANHLHTRQFQVDKDIQSNTITTRLLQSTECATENLASLRFESSFVGATTCRTHDLAKTLSACINGNVKAGILIHRSDMACDAHQTDVLHARRIQAATSMSGNSVSTDMTIQNGFIMNDMTCMARVHMESATCLNAYAKGLIAHTLLTNQMNAGTVSAPIMRARSTKAAALAAPTLSSLKGMVRAQMAGRILKAHTISTSDVSCSDVAGLGKLNADAISCTRGTVCTTLSCKVLKATKTEMNVCESGSLASNRAQANISNSFSAKSLKVQARSLSCRTLKAPVCFAQRGFDVHLKQLRSLQQRLQLIDF